MDQLFEVPGMMDPIPSESTRGAEATLKRVSDHGYTITGDYTGDDGKIVDFKLPNDDLKAIQVGGRDSMAVGSSPNEDVTDFLVYDPARFEAKKLRDQHGQYVTGDLTENGTANEPTITEPELLSQGWKRIYEVSASAGGHVGRQLTFIRPVQPVPQAA